jgi:hypothetical protein
MAARDNARETDGVPRGSDGWLFLRATIDSIDSFSDQLSSEKEWREFDHYGLTRPLTAVEAEQVRKLARAHYEVDMNSPQVRAFMRHETDVEPLCIIDEARVGRNSISFLIRDTGEEIIVISGKKRQAVMRKLLHDAGTCDVVALRKLAFAHLPPRHTDPTNIKTRAVAGAAYKTNDIRSTLTHAVDVTTYEPLCRRVKSKNILDDPYAVDDENAPATCPLCAKRDPRFN